MESICTFDWYACGRGAKWFQDLENHYCDIHGAAVRSLKEHAPLETLVLSSNKISDSVSPLKDYDEAKLIMGMIKEQYPKAVEIIYSSMVGQHHIWLEPDHPLLQLIGDDLREHGLIVNENKEQ